MLSGLGGFPSELGLLTRLLPRFWFRPTEPCLTEPCLSVWKLRFLSTESWRTSPHNQYWLNLFHPVSHAFLGPFRPCFPQGEIIDNINHTFITGCKWGTCPTPETDVRSWSRCPGFSRSLRNSVTNQHNGRVSQLGACSHVFMRWKECFFVDMPQVTAHGDSHAACYRLQGELRSNV